MAFLDPRQTVHAAAVRQPQEERLDLILRVMRACAVVRVRVRAWLTVALHSRLKLVASR